jgi:hypothetical protein
MDTKEAFRQVKNWLNVLETQISCDNHAKSKMHCSHSLSIDGRYVCCDQTLCDKSAIHSGIVGEMRVWWKP